MNIINEEDLREIILQNIPNPFGSSYIDVKNMIEGITTDIKYQICRNLFGELSPLNDNV